jgi:hypothetical protein
VLAEYADRAIERRVRIEFPWSCHEGQSKRSGTIIQDQLQNFSQGFVSHG